MDDRLAHPQGNRGSDILMMFKLKAEAPQKYREEVKVVGIDQSKMMLDKLREMASKDVQQAALEAPAVEGQYREVAPPAAGVWAPAEPHEKAPGNRPSEEPPAKQPPPKESAKDRRAAQMKAERAAG
jgi:hypothetical protein